MDSNQADVATLEQESRQMRARMERLEKENGELRSVCAEAYQLAGAYDAPIEALDNLSASANGDPLPHETFLPVAPHSAGLSESSDADRLTFENIGLHNSMVAAQAELAECKLSAERLQAALSATVGQRDKMLAALYMALPFVEDHEDSYCYKSGVIPKAVKQIKDAIASVEQPASVAAPGASEWIEWIEWKGGECPVCPNTLVEIRLRTGGCDDNKASRFWWDHREVEAACDIVAYRVVQSDAA